MNRTLAALSLVAVALSSAGCSSMPFVGRDRGSDKAPEASEDDGRIAVIPLEEELQPDPRFIGVFLDLPPVYANAEWTQPGGEADHVMHHLSAPETLSPAWRARVSRGAAKRAPVTSVPVVAENKVFTLDPEARVTALDIIDGQQVWTKVLTPDLKEAAKPFWRLGKPDPATFGFGGGLAYDGGWLYMANGFAQAAALNATTGEILWQVDLSAPVRNPPTAANGKVYVVTIDNQLIALDQATGEVEWTHQSFEESARVLSSGSPAVDGDLLVAPFSSGEVVTLDADTGRLLWSATIAQSSRLNALSTLNDIAGSPVIDRGGIFAVSHAGQLAAIDGRTGRVAWGLSVSSRNTPWVAGDIIYVVSVDGDLIAVSRGDGAVIWREELPAYENPKKRKGPISWSGPILAGGRLILTSSSGRMMQVDPQDGDILETYRLKSGSNVPPIVAGDTVYVLNDAGTLEAWR